MLIRAIYVRQPGSVGDKRTFRRSRLGQRILRYPAGAMETQSLLGDGGYTLIEKVIIPYKDNGALTPQFVVDHITSCAVLHNFIILEGDALEPDMEPKPDLDDDDVNLRQL
ncbi:hypothetical protein FOCC_FOCC012672 [Frankliniella occidentalis]|nr:hypothetical protein FOCC_FOCC012672 [Frankliniella occidentalis]